MFHKSILQVQEELKYHKSQQEQLEQQLYALKSYEEFAAQAYDNVKETIEQIQDPKYLQLFKESLLSLFPTEKPVYLEENIEVIDSPTVEEKKDKEFGSLSYYELTGKPDTRPDTYEDIAHNITYSSSGRAYVGFNDKQQAEEFRESITEPCMLSDTETMNGYKYEVKFYCDRKYLDELLTQLHNDDFEQDEDWTPEQKAELDFQERLIRTAPDIFYDGTESTCYLGFKAKGRADNYGSYLTRILDIAEKYTVTNKPRVTTNTKYELRLEAIAEEDAKHLAKFDLKKDYDHPDNREAREVWRTTRKREVPPACKPLPRSTPLDDIRLGEIVSVGTNSKQYKVIDHVVLDGVPHLEVVATYNSEMPALVGKTSYLKEVYRVLKEDIHVNSKLEESKSDLSFPAPPYKEIPLDQVELCD
nr:hypothetical protein [Pleurocapsa sp. MO_226.B13]